MIYSTMKRAARQTKFNEKYAKFDIACANFPLPVSKMTSLFAPRFAVHYAESTKGRDATC